jgi:hypothetical protein
MILSLYIIIIIIIIIIITRLFETFAHFIGQEYCFYCKHNYVDCFNYSCIILYPVKSKVNVKHI